MPCKFEIIIRYKRIFLFKKPLKRIHAFFHIKHGKIRIAFTPDEAIGRGVDHFDVAKFGADYAYTVDGGSFGEISCENFNASAAKVTFA